MTMRQGYADGLLGKPPQSACPDYLHGHRNGTTDRRHFNLTVSWCGDSNVAIDRAVYPVPGRADAPD